MEEEYGKIYIFSDRRSGLREDGTGALRAGPGKTWVYGSEGTKRGAAGSGARAGRVGFLGKYLTLGKVFILFAK